MSNSPTVVFIDDSATMREVIKIAFRRESMDVIAFSDAMTALQHIEQKQPDIVITDVIMPEKDGYDVCQWIKQNPRLARIPVILMSGVVNRSVAEKAFSVKADELIRKPFQPQDLLTRVKHLLTPQQPQATLPPSKAAATLSTIFGSASNATRPMARPPIAAPSAMPQPVMAAAMPRTPVQAMPRPASNGAAAAVAPAPVAQTGVGAVTNADMQKLRMEVMQLQGLVKKLQGELQGEREYVRSLEEQLRILQQ